MTELIIALFAGIAIGACGGWLVIRAVLRAQISASPSRSLRASQPWRGMS